MKSNELRTRFLEFFKEKGHKIVPSSSLVPTDPSVLFTTAGMQQFKPYYLGEKSPYGKNVATCQKCIRTSDIEEVGDERHLTFFEMLGNFSFALSSEVPLGRDEGGEGYFKEKTIKLAKEFLDSINIKIDYVTVFKGDENVPKDTESESIWNELGFSEKKGNLKFFGREDNFWGPTGDEGPCGPTTEIYAGGIEIWNIVFNQYYQNKDKSLKNLDLFGIDTGMGLERLAMVSQKKSNVFETDLFKPLIDLIPEKISEKDKRIIADHAKAIAFLISEGIIPSNKEEGYVLRRLIRRIATKEHMSSEIFIENVLEKIAEQYKELNIDKIKEEFNKEKIKFLDALKQGIKEFEKIKNIDSKSAFKLYESFGLPFDILKDLAPNLSQKDFESELEKHKELSKTASAGMFKGGLADESENTVKLHTASHLLNQALRKIVSKDIKQRGSNITSERLRFDFNFERKLTDEEIKKVEDEVNDAIGKDLEVEKLEMSYSKAVEMGAQAEFGTKYPEKVSVYKIGEYSLEICRGPHVKRTSELKKIKIIKEESSSKGVRRIKAILE